MHARSIVLCLLFIGSCVASYGQVRARDSQAEQVIRKNLASIAPAAVDAFDRGTAALDAGDYEQAIRSYQEVLQQAPTFTPAMRRLGASLAANGQTQNGLKYCEKAVQLERSPENLAMLAHVLVQPNQAEQGTPEQKERALLLAREASNRYRGPDDFSFLVLVTGIALDLQRTAEFRKTADRLIQQYPATLEAHYFHAIELAMDRDWIASDNEIRRAERLGLPAQTADSLLATGIRRRALEWRLGYSAVYAAIAWVCGFFVLFGAGKVFSKLTLSLLAKNSPTLPVSGAPVFLRWCYRQLINVAGAYYYISIPFVIALVLSAAGGMIYPFLWIGAIPIVWLAPLAVGAIVTVYALVHSLFVRISRDDPGRRLRREEAPDLWNLTREVAAQLETRPLDEIRLTPGIEMEVLERGSSRERRNDSTRRILIMGLGLLPGLDQDSFCAILAHEYGHFSHRDTLGGEVALRVSQNMGNFAYAIAEARQAVWWNIGFQFLRAYAFLFRRISYGAIRLQEILADRAAARAYGAEALENGLRHVVRRKIEFPYIASKVVKDALNNGRAMPNVYTLELPLSAKLETAIDKELYRQTSENDTHPSPVDRFRLIRGIPAPNRPPTSGAMWDLFKDSSGVMREMNIQVEYEGRGSTALRRQVFLNAGASRARKLYGF